MLFSKLSEKDKLAIDSYVKEYCDYGDSHVYGTFAPLEHRLAVWNREKETLFQAFGESLILEKEVEYHKGAEELSDEIYNKMYDENSNTGKFFSYMRENVYEKYSDNYYLLRDLFDSFALAQNLWTGRFMELPMPDGHTLQINTGAKLVKMLGKIAKAYSEEAYRLFEEFRLEHSQILNVKALKGTLCLSIHPLDYMTMSDNMSDWNSCMSWTDGGSYRRGTVEMMNSPMVVVGYLRSDKEFPACNGCTWNDKRWRCLFVVNEDTIVSIKGYPYYHEELTQACVSWLRDLVSTNIGWQYHDEIRKMTYDTREEHFGYVVRLCPHARGAMYNDFGYTTHWGVLKKYDIMPEDLTLLNFNYCGPSTCMCCGAVEPYFEEEGYVCCGNCQEGYYEEEEERYYCERCDRGMYYDDVIWFDGDPYCDCCIGYVANYCAVGETWRDKEDTVRVYLASLKDQPDPENDVACWVHNRYLIEGLDYGWPRVCTRGNYPHKWVNPDNENDVRFYWNVEDLTSEGISSYYHLWGSEIDSYVRQI